MDNYAGKSDKLFDSLVKYCQYYPRKIRFRIHK